jgi:hypothetical protein
LRSREMHTGFWRGNLKQREHLLDQDVDGEINIKTGWEGVDWIGTSGGLL